MAFFNRQKKSNTTAAKPSATSDVAGTTAGSTSAKAAATSAQSNGNAAPAQESATPALTAPTAAPDTTAATAAKRVQEVALKQIVPNRHQPRKQFGDESISELAETIAAHGLLQPIILREYEPRHYEIIAGERRFRAVQALAWRQIPAIVTQMDSQESAEMAVIENLQREDLNAIDEASAYQDLLAHNQLTQAQLAQRVGKSQSYIANKLRLLKLPIEAQEALASGKISPRHGRALLQLDATAQAIVLKQILTDNLTVTQTDALIKRLSQPEPAPTVAGPELPSAASTGAKSPTKAAGRLTGGQRQHVGNADLRVAVNTVKQSIKLIEASGAQVSYQEALAGQSYQVTIKVTVPEAPAAPDSKAKEEN